ncbi:MAG: MBL fold metallo-hydrolase [Deinococcales bacterium]
MRLTFLGSADSQGVPRWWCDCVVCEEARERGINRRKRSALLIEYQGQTSLIDAGPDIREQLDRVRLRKLDRVLITHAHHDHIAGITDIATFASRNKVTVSLYAVAEVLEQLKTRFAYLSHNPHLPFYALTGSETLGDYHLKAIKVPHGHNGESYAFLFSGPKRWAYMSDVIDLQDLSPWRDLDVLIIGTSFFKESHPRQYRSIYDVTEVLELTSHLRPQHTILTHLGHDIDQLNPQQRLPLGFSYAYDGLKLEI